MDNNLILRAREMIGDLTPMLSDCGAYCGAACCEPDEDGQGGVYLFPGEETLMQDVGWGRLETDRFGAMLVCHGPCSREQRPLACRIFPLTPVKKRTGAGRCGWTRGHGRCVRWYAPAFGA